MISRKFDLGKIGTGEGAQVYGHGLYFAENPAVSGQGGQYWKSFKDRFYEPEITAAERLQRAGFDRDKAAAEVQKLLERTQEIATKETPALRTEHADILAAYNPELIIYKHSLTCLRAASRSDRALTR